jgi:hypothetical protein
MERKFLFTSFLLYQRNAHSIPTQKVLRLQEWRGLITWLTHPSTTTIYLVMKQVLKQWLKLRFDLIVSWIGHFRPATYTHHLIDRN